MLHPRCQSLFIVIVLLVGLFQALKIEGTIVTSQNHEQPNTVVSGEPSLDLAKLSTRMRRTCPILIPFDLPEFPSSVIGRQKVDRDKERGLSWNMGQYMNKQAANGSVSPNIVGGLITGLTLRRYLISLEIAEPCKNGRVGCVKYGHCTGTMIHPEWIISAAHCLIDAVRVRVFVNTPSLGNGFDVLLEDWWIHPKYDYDDSDTNGYDLAVGKISIDVVRACNRNRRRCGGSAPTVMKINTVQTSPREGMYVRTIGFGDTVYDERRSDGRLRQVDAPIANFDTCAKNYITLPRRPDRTVIQEDLQMCVGYLSGECDSCQGDSGGPVVAYLDGGPVLVGVTSFGEECALEDLPGVAVRVSAHVEWLESLKVPFTRSSMPFPSVGPMCKNGEFLSHRPGRVAVCEECPSRTFSLAPEQFCYYCPRTLFRDTEDGSMCSCRRRVNFGINRRGNRCVRCRRGTSSPVGSNVCS